ncbi:34-kDa subunit of RNA polymerase III (C), partial [Phlyctochytrium bullatum]
QGMVEFLKLSTGKLGFKAINEEEVQKTKGLTSYEKIIYNLIKGEKGKGIWIKELKDKSGLHTKVVTDSIKNMEKTGLIKSVKSVKGYPTATKIAKFINRAKISSVKLSLTEIQMLLDRLEFDDKIQKLIKFASDEVYSDGNLSDEELGTVDQILEGNLKMYKARRVKDIEDIGFIAARSAWTDIPCGRCPVASFCTLDGPINPSDCVYLEEWLRESVLTKDSMHED